MTALSTDLRTRLGNSIVEARKVAERGARQALEVLAVDRRDPHGSMAPESRTLRNRLRAHGRQLGDSRDAQSGTQTISRIVREVAYEHWHRMLFARFLAENHLLIEPVSGVAITMEECEDLARERRDDPWALAASFAQGMLPQIFRADDPALAVTLPPETRQALQRLLSDLPSRVFTEGDSLGWTYQYWQAAEKEAVNARAKSGEKITGEMLPAVTQLFTEHYMVQFLLDNTIGAWHAGRVLTDSTRKAAGSERDLRDAVRLDAEGGYDFEYLRFVRESEEADQDEKPTGAWRPAAGTFDGWPKAAQDLTVLDPCCGSGHFIVAAFELLVRLRMQEEGLEVCPAVRAVIAENLFALELDARCTQIAAFNLALAAWRMVGSPIELPPMRIACSGIGSQASREEWVVLAERNQDVWEAVPPDDRERIRNGLGALHDTFSEAPELGSLIDPRRSSDDLFTADYDTLHPFLEAVLGVESTDEEGRERAVAAKGMADAAEILVGPTAGYTLVLTNVPYLGRASHTDEFKAWADLHEREARNNLATIFVSRMLRWIGEGDRAGTMAAVTPHNWLFLTGYRRFRESLLKEKTWQLVAWLGPKGFQTPMWDLNVMLAVLSANRPILPNSDDTRGHIMAGVDVMAAKSPNEKAAWLRGYAQRKRDGEVSETSSDGTGAEGGVMLVPQAEQLENPDARVSFSTRSSLSLLSTVARYGKGSTTGDKPRFLLGFWEFGILSESSVKWLDSPTSVLPWSGRSLICSTPLNAVELTAQRGCRIHGQQVWGEVGVVVNKMSDLQHFLYRGEVFDDNVGVLAPHDPSLIPAVWAFCDSGEYRQSVRRIDQALKVTAATLVKVPFDLARWQKVAEKKYPDGLPEPYSDDPTQWLFHGHPARAEPVTALQVGVARLLGYRWPAEFEREMHLSDEARALVERSRELGSLGLDDDGIVCLSPVRGEGSAADRLRSLLAAAFGDDWSAAKEHELLAGAAEADHGKGRPAESLDAWLRSDFFEEHCKLFHHRPFVWHIWDGLKDGFSAFVNYHMLAGPDGLGRRTLESLTFTYLGEWIERQRADQLSGQEGSDARLAAALRLQQELQKILEGEPPYDLFVRWKPLHEQPVGWHPDINDGVRMNVRPLLMAQDVGRKHAGVLRWKPNIKWNKDRGKEPKGLRPREHFPWFWGCQPDEDTSLEEDFGVATPETDPSGTVFDGARWNALHYTRAAKELARKRFREEEEA